MSARSLRVAMPTSSFLPSLGGAEVGLHNIADRLIQRGHRPIIITSMPHWRSLRREGWQLRYPVLSFPPKIWGVLRHFPPLGYWLLDATFARLHRRYRFDVWHSTIGYPVGVALTHFAHAHGKIPHLVRCTGEDIQSAPEIEYGMRLSPRVDAHIRKWLPRANRLVAITDTVAAEYHALGVPEARIARIPNGVDLERFARPVDRSAVRRALGIAENTFVYLCVGRNHKKKGYDTLLRAAAPLMDKHRNITLAAVGAGVGTLAGQASQLDIADRVHLIETFATSGHPDDSLMLPSDALVDLYKAADVFVLPSYLETFGIVLIEAMAAGLPVITTTGPGCRDVVRAGVDGLGVPVHDVDALTEAMWRLYREPETRHRFADAAQARSKSFSWDLVTDAYVELYHELIRENRANTREVTQSSPPLAAHDST